MGLYTARSKQRANPFAALSRQKAAAQKQSKKAAAPPEPEDAPEPEPAAVPFDRNPESEEYEQAPDISTYTTGGVVGQSVIGPASAPEEHEQANPAPVMIDIPAATQAKIEAVMNHAIPPVDESAKAWANPDPAEIDAQVTRRETVESEPESGAKRGRGRPRPPETIARDNAVHELLVKADPETGISKEQIAVKLNGEKEQQVYSSLRQLTKEGRAETRYVKPHGYRWFAV